MTREGIKGYTTFKLCSVFHRSYLASRCPDLYLWLFIKWGWYWPPPLPSHFQMLFCRLWARSDQWWLMAIKTRACLRDSVSLPILFTSSITGNRNAILLQPFTFTLTRKKRKYENLIHLHLHRYKSLSMKYCLFGRIYLYRDRETARKDFKKVSANGKHPTFFSGKF